MIRITISRPCNDVVKLYDTEVLLHSTGIPFLYPYHQSPILKHKIRDRQIPQCDTFCVLSMWIEEIKVKP